MEQKIYWSSIEYRYCENSEKYGKLLGGFVYVFLKAFDAKEALSKIIVELKEEKLDPVEIEFVKPYEADLEWETLEQTMYYLELFEKAKSSEYLIFDDFHAYENE